MAASWAAQLLAAIGAPQSDANLTALGLWASSEGIDPQANNPLAATDKAPGSTPLPGAPAVQQYVSVAQMVSVYVGKLESSTYAAVGSALKQDAGLVAIWTAINQSPWCSGCQGGLYPTALHAATGPGGNVPAPGTQGPTGGNQPAVNPPGGVQGPVGEPDPLSQHGPQAFHRLQLALGKHLPTRMAQVKYHAGMIRTAARGHR